MMTIEEMRAAINPLPAMLSAKGRQRPEVTVEFEANRERVYLWLTWIIEHNPSYHGERTRKLCSGDNFGAALAMAREEIATLPSAIEEQTHRFMRDLAKLIEHGNKIGLDLEYMNPLTENMKKLSENVITYQPSSDDADTIPF